jgi:DNA helicase-2/ATP-dependent DNA helicase PcrA
VSPLRRLADGEVQVPASARAEFDDLRELVKILDDSGPSVGPAASVAVQVDRIGRFLQPAFMRLYVSVQSRVRDVEQLANLAGGSRSRASFLADLTLDPPVSTGDLAGPPLLDEDYLILSTIHSAKGCEWDAVHVLHAADGSIPSDMATGHAEQIEEERRLLYVAMTRARNALTVHFPMRYYQGQRPLSDRHAYAQRTRFIPDEVAELFDRRTTYAEDEAAMASPQGPGASKGREAVDAMLGQLWD